MRAELLAEAEEVLRDYGPETFDDLASLAGPECIAAVALVEVTGVWQASYPSLEAFYAAHEGRHPDVRLYSTVRDQILNEDVRESAGGTIAQRLQATAVHRSRAA